MRIDAGGKPRNGRRRDWLLGGAGLLVIAALVGWPTLSHQMDVDHCYDSGGVYLSELRTCSHSQAEIDAYLPRRTGF